MSLLILLGTLAGALIAIGTVVRYAIRRLIRATVWAAAVVRLPDTLTELSTAVGSLAAAVDRLQPTPDREPVPL
jgi:hypothetical protein